MLLVITQRKKAIEIIEKEIKKEQDDLSGQLSAELRYAANFRLRELEKELKRLKEDEKRSRRKL